MPEKITPGGSPIAQSFPIQQYRQNKRPWTTRQEALVDMALMSAISDPETIRKTRPVVPMEVMPDAKLQEVNRRIRDSKLVSRDGTVLTTELRGALITRDGKLAYPVEDEIPVLLEDHGIVLSQLEGQ